MLCLLLIKVYWSDMVVSHCSSVQEAVRYHQVLF